MGSWDPLSWDWATAAKTFFSAGLGTAAVQAVLPFFRDRWHRKSLATYMAMRLAVTLESYSSTCSDFILENEDTQKLEEEESAEENRSPSPNYDTKIPDLPPYPDDAEGWRAIDAKLANRCLNLTQKIRQSQETINLFINAPYGDAMDDVADLLHKFAAERGLEALDLADDLRDKHNVDSSALHIRDHLKNKRAIANTNLRNRGNYLRQEDLQNP